MTARSVRSFLPTLRSVDSTLTVPVPGRLRLLEELEHDLEAVTRRYVGEGHSPEEARRLAVELLVPQGAALDALEHVHRGWFARVTGGLGQLQLRVIERTVLFGAMALVCAITATAMARADLFADPSPFLGAVLAVGVLLVLASGRVGIDLWLKSDLTAAGPQTRTVVLLSAAVLLVGVVGVGVDFYRLTATMAAGPADPETTVLRWIRQDAALLGTAVALALSGALCWFASTQWWALVWGARLEVLGLDRTSAKGLYQSKKGPSQSKESA